VGGVAGWARGAVTMRRRSLSSAPRPPLPPPRPAGIYHHRPAPLTPRRPRKLVLHLLSSPPRKALASALLASPPCTRDIPTSASATTAPDAPRKMSRSWKSRQRPAAQRPAAQRPVEEQRAISAVFPRRAIKPLFPLPPWRNQNQNQIPYRKSEPRPRTGAQS
jgi:hypothetical protein